MNIHEAVKLAHERGTGIYRDTRIGTLIIPTNTHACCVVSALRENATTSARWQPTLRDLIADDWAVYGRISGDELG